MNTQVKNPSLYGLGAGSNYWLSIKHQRVIEYNGYLYHAGGDFAGWPFGNGTAGFPPNPASDPYGYDGRQDMWRASVSQTVITSGVIEWELAQNAYHNYPWNGTSGYFGPGNPGGGTLPERGPYSQDALPWCVDKRGDFWMGPTTVGYETTYQGEAAGQYPGYPAMFKWKMPGIHTNGIRYGNGWTLPNQDRLQIDIPVPASIDARGYGRPNDSAYDPVTDAIYVVGSTPNNLSKGFNFQLYKFSCVPVAGKNTWSRLDTSILWRDMGVPSSATSANDSWNKGSCAIVGRWFYFPMLATYGGVPTNHAGDNFRYAVIIAINIDTLATKWVPFPTQQNWWIRGWDGPQSDAGAVNPLTPGQARQMRSLNGRLVCGPDGWIKIGVDPWIAVHDPAKGSWSLFTPPTSHDWPNSLGTMVAVESVNEVWLIGNLPVNAWNPDARAFVQANGLHYPPDNAGRRIVRLGLG